jgi:uncharacterized protein
MSGVIDTNLLLYALNRDCPEHAQASAFLDAARESSGVFYLTEGIAYEFLRVATHPRVFDAPLAADAAMRFLEILLGWPNVALLAAGPRHWRGLRAVLNKLHAPAGNLFFDIRTVTLMREHGIRALYTADADFHRFEEIEVINPLLPRD